MMNFLLKHLPDEINLHDVIMDAFGIGGFIIGVFGAFSRNTLTLDFAVIILFAAFVLVSLFYAKLKNESVKWDDLYFKEKDSLLGKGHYKYTPLISDITYLAYTRHPENKPHNELSITSVSSTYNFLRDPAHNSFNGKFLPISEQRISYCIKGINKAGNSVLDFKFYQIWSELTNNSAENYSAYLIYKKNQIPLTIMEFEKINPTCARIKVNLGARGIAPQEKFILKLVRTSQNINFTNSETFIFDPSQYEDTANFQWTPNFTTDSPAISNCEISLYSVSRKNLARYKLIDCCKFDEIGKEISELQREGKLQCCSNKIYIFRVVYPCNGSVHLQKKNDMASV